jgi:site-specific DNA recombinase
MRLMNSLIWAKSSLPDIEEPEAIMKKLEKTNYSISNLEEKIAAAFNLSAKLSTVWHSSDTAMKEELQKLVFPDGIVYDRTKDAFRTGKVNVVFTQFV